MRKIIALITLYSFAIQAATITDDKVLIGKKSSASAKELIFDTADGAANKKLSIDKVTKKLSITSDETLVGDGTQSDKALTFNRGGSNAQVKWNEVTDKLQFSNDGTTFKDLGTGGGGGGSTGVNVLTNDSFEDAVGGVLTDWSNTGGTLTQVSYTNAVEGDAKYFQFVATTSGQYFEMVKTVPTNFNGSGCQVDFKKLNIATADLFKVEALDASNNVLATGNVKVSSWVKFPTLSFVCPTAGSTFKIRVTSLAAGTLQGDKAYLGSNQNIVNTIASNDTDWASYSPTFTGGASYSNEGVFYKRKGGDLIVRGTGTITTPGAVAFSVSIPSGLVIDSSKQATTTDTNSVGYLYRLTGTISSTYATTSYGVWPAFTDTAVSTGTIYFSTSTNGARFQKNTGANFFVTGDRFRFEFSVPIVGWSEIRQQDIAVSNEQASWFIDANIGGANIALGTSNLTSYTEMTDASLDLVINSNKGSSSAEIACASGTSSSGLTCSSAEAVGIAFTPATVGRHKVCFSFAHFVDSNSTEINRTIFQLIETPNNSTTILQEGGERISSEHLSGSSVTYVDTKPLKVCGNFVFNDISKKTIRLMREQEVSGVPNSNVRGDRLANNGQKDIHISIENVTFAQNRPILTGDQMTVPTSVKPVHYSGMVNGSGVVSNKKGSFASSCTWGGLSGGVATCPLTTTHTTRLNCTCSVSDAVASAAVFWCMPLASGTSSSQSFVTYANAVGPRDFTYQCDGELP